MTQTRFPPNGFGVESRQKVGAADLPASVATVSSTFKTYYVSTTGNDSNDGSSQGKALLTLGQALTLATAASGGYIKMSPGNYALPTAGLQIGSNNITIEGSGMDITTLTITNGTGYGIDIGHDTFTAGGGQYTNFHISKLTINLTGANSQTQALAIGSVKNWSVDHVRCLGSWYPMTIGGSGNKLPAQNGHWTRSVLEGSLYDNALINCENVWVTDNTFIGSVTARTTIDLEPNGQTDSMRGVVIARNKIYGQGAGGILMQWGTMGDPQRARGVQIIDNQFFDTFGITCKLPGAIIKGNVIKATVPYLGGYAPSGGILISRDAPMPAADECIVENNEVDNMVATNKGAAIILEGVSHCRVRGNVVHEDAQSPLTGYPVQERQRNAAIVSGFQLGTPSAMTVPVGAGTLQKDAVSLFPAYTAGALVTKTAQTATITAASAYDRIDTIYLDPVTAVVTVAAGTQALYGLAPAPAYPNGNFVVVGYVYVHANEVSVAAADLSDGRVFVAHDNEIDHQPGVLVPQLGEVGLVNPNSSRRIRRISPLRTDAYARSVLVDGPLLYFPLTEVSGQIANGFGLSGGFGHYVGGVALNQQIGATARFGATFDGTGSVIVQRPDEFIVNGPLCTAPFTLEAQVMPSDTSDFFLFAFQGFSGSKDFEWGLYSNLKQFLDFGNSSDQVSTGALLSTTALTHIAVDWDGANLKFYFGGTLDSTLTPVAPTYSFNNAYSYLPIHIGYNDNAAHPFYKGFIRHFAMYAPNIGGTRIAAHAAAM